jgi:hypothetical protein
VKKEKLIFKIFARRIVVCWVAVGACSESQVVLSLRPHGFELETTTTLRAGAGFGLPTAMTIINENK